MEPVALVGLEREWETIVRGSLAARFRVWRRSEPRLSRFAGPVELISFLRGPGSWEQKDAVLLALLSRARVEPLAGRVVLEAILPGLRVRVRGLGAKRGVDVDELWQIVLASAWRHICGYPLERRPHKAAANLIMDTYHDVVVELKRSRVGRAELSDKPLEERLEEEPAPLPDDPTEPPELLAQAVAAGAISQAEAALILATHVEGFALGEVAAPAGVSYNALKLRRQRAEQRLGVHLGVLRDPKGRSKRRLHAAYEHEPEHHEKRMLHTS